jgi:hypothetical protein
MKKKSRKGKKRNMSKKQRFLESVQQCESKVKLINSWAGEAGSAITEWSELARAAETWRRRKFDTAGKVMLAESKNGAHNG